MLSAIRWVFCDVDGVLTDARLRYGAAGEDTKVFHSRDGHLLRLAQRRGLGIGLLSGRETAAVRHRAEELGLGACLLGVGDKHAVLGSWLAAKGLDWSVLGFIGDDLPDLSCLEAAAFSAAPADAQALIRRRVDRVATLPGGQGAVGEILCWLLRRQGRWAPDGSDLHG